MILLNKLVLNSESLNKVLERENISRDDISEIYQNAESDPTELFLAGSESKKEIQKKHGNIFQKSIF